MTELDEDVVEMLKRSAEQQGELQPVIKDQHGNLLAGRHRKAAKPDWRETTIMVTDDLDRELKILHFNVQRRPTKEETTKRLLAIAKILESRGIAKSEIVQNIAKLVPYKERWVRELLPDEYKRKYEPEPQIGSTAELPIETQDMPLVECECCGMGTREPKPFGKYEKLCDSCYLKAVKYPRLFAKEPAQKPKPKPLYKEKWEDRVARMKTPVSKMDEAIWLRLKADKDIAAAGWKIEFQKSYCLVKTTPEFTLTKGDVKIGSYLDGEEAHKNRKERDEELRQMLEQRYGVKPLPIPYPRWSKSEEDRIFKQIKEALT